MHKKAAYVAVTLMILLPTYGFVKVQDRLLQVRPHYYNPIATSPEQIEERKKQNPITISQFMGQPYNQVTMSEVLQKMINEGSDFDLYWVKDKVWACNWTRHEKQFKGIGLDPEDAVANAISQSLSSDPR